MDSIQGTFKVVVLGEQRVGKTSISIRFARNEFNDKQQSTVDATCLEQNVRIPDASLASKMATYKLSVWDTAGQEQFHALNNVYYRGAQGALIVYDITDVDSFKKMQNWVKELRKVCDENLPIILVGNKTDLEKNR